MPTNPNKCTQIRVQAAFLHGIRNARRSAIVSARLYTFLRDKEDDLVEPIVRPEETEVAPTRDPEVPGPDQEVVEPTQGKLVAIQLRKEIHNRIVVLSRVNSVDLSVAYTRLAQAAFAQSSKRAKKR